MKLRYPIGLAVVLGSGLMVSTFIIHGDFDAAVPLRTNSAEIQRRYRAMGGNIELVVPAGQRRNMWPGFFQCQALTDIVIQESGKDALSSQFRNPPDAARPWVYWFVMDGNLTREGITADFEAMKRAGVGGMIFMEVNVGIPRGPVAFMSEPWRKLLQHAMAEANRLGLQFALAAGPGWCGTGGPWIKPEQSMQHLVAAETVVKGPKRFDAVLPRPRPRTPFFGKGTLTPELAKVWQEYYRDEAVLAFPSPQGSARIADIDEKALYHRAPFSSQPGVKPFLPAAADHPATAADQCIAPDRIIDLTKKLGPDGRLTWDVPRGDWTIMRFGRTTTGQTSRPAPSPGLGFESDKFDRAAIDSHFASYIDPLLKALGSPANAGRGLTTLHFDSWEMSSQNWSEKFRAEFQKRRGYDPLPYLPVMAGRIVASNELSERFLWDLRQTAQELVVENHVLRLKDLGRRHGLQLSIEPYDLNPCADLTLGGAADVPMCEFWAKGHIFDTTFSCIEAVSIAHTRGRPIVGAESFTSGGEEAWRLYPGAMKAQADWALCAGINRITFHRYQHQPWTDRRPGMTMGPYGVHWERTQTWWDMVPAFHTYLSRCQAMLRRGLPVADILYLNPEGAPLVFQPPRSALRGNPPDRLGYNFDGIAPETLIERISVKDGRLTLPEGTSYRVLVLPEFDTMTPALLDKIKSLVEAGATVVGSPPRKSPSLVNYPKCDEEIKRLAAELWGKDVPASEANEHRYGKGRVVRDPGVKDKANAKSGPYPGYEFVAGVLGKMNVLPDFDADKPLRYIHRRDGGADIYFVANGSAEAVEAKCTFRVSGKTPELWNPVTGEMRPAAAFEQQNGRTVVPLSFDPSGSTFVVFREPTQVARAEGRNFPTFEPVTELAGPWTIEFDTKWGGPQQPVTFETLVDWTKRPEDGIRHYSGKAVYRKTFELAELPSAGRMHLKLGRIQGMAEVRLNGRPLGVVWCEPWRIEITGALQRGKNELEITVANLWPNRLIGDSALPQEKRYTWTTWNPYQPNSALLESGLLGPVRVERAVSEN